MFKRMLAMLLCIVMTLCMLPMTAMATEITDPVATEAVEETAELTVQEPGKTDASANSSQWWIDEAGDYCFDSFAGLKELAQKTYDSNTVAYYRGEDSLQITEDLVVPENLQVAMLDSGSEYMPINLYVNEGVTLTVKGLLDVNSLIVLGTLRNERYVGVNKMLVVEGKLRNYADLYISKHASFAGRDNVTFESDTAYASLGFEPHSAQDFYAALAEAATYSKPWWTEIDFVPDASAKLQKSMEIPENCSVKFHGNPITLTQGNTLTVSGNMDLYADFVVAGTLENNGCISQSSNLYDNVVEFKPDSGKYSGSGIWFLNVDEGTAWTDMIKGLNTDELKITQEEDDVYRIENLADIPKLATPTELIWGKEYDWSNEDLDITLHDRVGSITWNAVLPRNQFAQVTIYREDGLQIAQENVDVSSEEDPWRSSDLFIRAEPESGNYFFTVQYLSASPEYRDGEPAVSAMYHYTKPTKKLATPTNLHWMKPQADEKEWAEFFACWIGESDYYEVERYFATSTTQTPFLLDAYTGNFTNYGFDSFSPDYVKYYVDTYGPGYFYFRVRALPENTDKMRNSDWSAMSQPYQYPAKQITKLNKPSGVKASVNSTTGKPVISWNAVENAASYNIYRSTKSSSGFAKIGTASGKSFEDTTAKVGTKYYYKVRAVAGKVLSSYSSYVSATAKCAKPVVKASVTLSSGQVKLTWKKVDGAQKYEVYRVTASGKSTKIATTKNRYYTDSSATVGTTYTYKVKAIASKSANNSAFSTGVKAMRVCAQPDVVVKCSTSSGKPILSWKKVTGANKYFVLRSEDNIHYSEVKATTSTSYTDNKAEPGKTYYYLVGAYNAKSDVTNGDETAVKCLCTCAKPSVKVTLSNKKPKLTWKEVEGATKYYVYRATSKNGKYTKVATVTDATSFRDAKAPKGKTCYYKVKAVAANSKANSAYSSIFSIKSK